VEVGIVEVGVLPVVGCQANAASAVAKNFGEATVLGAEGVVVTEMPLAEHAGVVAVVLEDLPDCDFIETQHGASHDGVPAPVRLVQCLVGRAQRMGEQVGATW